MEAEPFREQLLYVFMSLVLRFNYVMFNLL